MSESRAKPQFDTDHETSSRVSMPITPVATERDSEFYFDDSLVVVQVEGTLFRVHKFQLLKSETFSDMFSMPKGSNTVPEEGATPENPIVLSGVKSSDFRALLRVLYAFYFTKERPTCEPGVIVPAFRLAHMWNFSDLRDHLLPLVKDSLDCVDKIVLARELGIQEWLAPAHVELCQRAESLTMEEGTKLGMNSTMMIFRLREQFRPAKSVSNSESTGDYCGGCVHYLLGSHGPTTCRQCRGSMTASYQYYRFTATPPSTAPPSSDSGLDSQVRKWVEGGCVTE